MTDARYARRGAQLHDLAVLWNKSKQILLCAYSH